MSYMYDFYLTLDVNDNDINLKSPDSFHWKGGWKDLVLNCLISY